jgi:hypothetical protein
LQDASRELCRQLGTQEYRSKNNMIDNVDDNYGMELFESKHYKNVLSHATVQLIRQLFRAATTRYTSIRYEKQV